MSGAIAVMMWRLLRNWSFDLTDDGTCRVDVFGILISLPNCDARRGDLERIIECVTLNDPSYDLTKFHLILRYVHELYTLVQV